MLYFKRWPATFLILGLLLASLLTSKAHAFWPWRHVKPAKAQTVQKRLEPDSSQGWSSRPAALSVQKTDSLWWQQLNDPVLNRYIDVALTNSPTLVIALERIKEARATARLALANEFPKVTVGASFARQHLSKTLTTPNISQLSSGSNVFSPGNTLNIYSVPLQASYEPDLFLKNWDKYKATRLLADSVAIDAKTIRLSLISDIATAYINLVKADRWVELQKVQNALLKSDQGRQQARYIRGSVSEDQVRIEDQLFINSAATLLEYQRLQALAAHQLATLLGKPAMAPDMQVATLTRTPLNRLLLPASVQAGLPSDIITHRPDVLSAEAKLKAAGFDVRATRKDFLPSFTLTGQFGYATTRLRTLFDWQSYLASVSAGATQTLFAGGAKVAALRGSKARYNQTVEAYRTALLNGFQETEDSLTNLQAHQNTVNSYTTQLGYLDDRLNLQQKRVKWGALTPYDLNAIKLEQVSALISQAGSHADSLTDWVGVMKATGGGG